MNETELREIVDIFQTGQENYVLGEMTAMLSRVCKAALKPAFFKKLDGFRA